MFASPEAREKSRGATDLGRYAKIDICLISPPGVILHRGYLDRAAQQNLALEIVEIIARAPLYICAMPRTGAPMSVRMTNCGELGWLSDKELWLSLCPSPPGDGRCSAGHPQGASSRLGASRQVIRRRRKPA